MNKNYLFLKSIKFCAILFCAGFLFLGFANSTNAAPSLANLIISSATLATDGKTMTVNITGISGSLSPASAITGFTVKLSTIPLQNYSVTSSGSVVTINLTNTVFSAQTVTVDLATSPTSNLTDTGSNTPTGQIGVAITNNSTQAGTTIAGSNSSLYWLGQWAAPSVVVGRNARYANGNYSRLDTVITGTTADILAYGGRGYTITIDGGTPLSGTVPGSGYTWMSVFSGLSDSAHTVKVVTLGSSSSMIIDSDTPFRVTGSNGAVSTPTGYGTYYALTSTPFSAYGRLDGSPGIYSGAGYTNYVGWPSCDSGVRFQAAVTDIWLWGIDSSSKLVVYQDGTEVSNFTPPGGSTWNLWHIASGLDGSSHAYEIVSVGSGTDGGFSLYGIMLTGGTGLVSQTPASRTTINWYGDSIVVEYVGGLTDSRQGFGWLVTRPLGLASNRQGFSGQKVSTYLRDNTSKITSLSPAPKVVILEGGVNDQGASVTIGDVNTAGTFAGDMKTMIANIAAGIPSTSTIFVTSILPNTATNFANRSLYTAAQQAAVNAYMAGRTTTAPAYFISTDNWVDPAVDGSLHPIASGNAKIANREIPLVNGIVNGSSYTVAGPSSGVFGQASINFTVTLPGGATFTGDQTITLSDGSNGGTFTPSVGSSGVSSVVVTPTNGLTSFTFTYTPASSGSKTLSFTNGQTWTDPTSASYTSTVAPPTFSSAVTNTAGTIVTASFSKTMSNPSGKQAQFAVLVNGSPNTVTTATLNADTTKIDLTLTDVVYSGQTVTVAYAAGTITSQDTGTLASFTAQSVTNNSTAVVSSTTTTAPVIGGGNANQSFFNKPVQQISQPQIQTQEQKQQLITDLKLKLADLIYQLILMLQAELGNN